MDDGRPPKSVNASVRINVQRNQPVSLVNSTITVNVDPNGLIGSPLATIKASDPDLKVSNIQL